MNALQTLSWAPGAVLGARRLGEIAFGPYQEKQVPTSMIIAAIGGAALIVGGRMTEPYGTLFAVGGYAIIGYSIYNLFGKSEPEKAAAPEPEPEPFEDNLGPTWP